MVVGQDSNSSFQSKFNCNEDDFGCRRASKPEAKIKLIEALPLKSRKQLLNARLSSYSTAKRGQRRISFLRDLRKNYSGRIGAFKNGWNHQSKRLSSKLCGDTSVQQSNRSEASSEDDDKSRRQATPHKRVVKSEECSSSDCIKDTDAESGAKSLVLPSDRLAENYCMESPQQLQSYRIKLADGSVNITISEEQSGAFRKLMSCVDQKSSFRKLLCDGVPVVSQVKSKATDVSQKKRLTSESESHTIIFDHRRNIWDKLVNKDENKRQVRTSEQQNDLNVLKSKEHSSCMEEIAPRTSLDKQLDMVQIDSNEPVELHDDRPDEVALVLGSAVDDSLCPTEADVGNSRTNTCAAVDAATLNGGQSRSMSPLDFQYDKILEMKERIKNLGSFKRNKNANASSCESRSDRIDGANEVEHQRLVIRHPIDEPTIAEPNIAGTTVDNSEASPVLTISTVEQHQSDQCQDDSTDDDPMLRFVHTDTKDLEELGIYFEGSITENNTVPTASCSDNSIVQSVDPPTLPCPSHATGIDLESLVIPFQQNEAAVDGVFRKNMCCSCPLRMHRLLQLSKNASFKCMLGRIDQGYPNITKFIVKVTAQHWLKKLHKCENELIRMLNTTFGRTRMCPNFIYTTICCNHLESTIWFKNEFETMLAKFYGSPASAIEARSLEKNFESLLHPFYESKFAIYQVISTFLLSNCVLL